jgi:site-specific recombinase XerD
VERLLSDAAQPITQLDWEAIEKHLRRLHVSGRGESVRQGGIMAIRSLGEWCLAHWIVEGKPGASLSGPSTYRREIKVLRVAEVGWLLWGNSRGTLSRDPLEMRNRVQSGVTYVGVFARQRFDPLEAEG